MPYIILLLVVCGLAIWFLERANKREQAGWIKAGGFLGFAVLLARILCIPLATVLTALPFILPHFRQAESRQSAASGATMTRQEAALILGVSPQARPDAVREAHRRLITKNHPDKGGNDYLAAKINQARDVLLS
jgi:uncharacterized membrane protein